MKYYEIFEETKVKDSRGNLTKTFTKIGEVRGELVSKRNRLFLEDRGLIVNYEKNFISNVLYEDILKIGNKIDEYVISEVLKNNSTIICILDKTI